MKVELGQGKGANRMKTWFERVMALDPKHSEACKLMSFYLEPRWYGSEQASLAFARSCVKSEKWSGEVPIVLSRVHHSLAKYYKLEEDPNYWHRPEVWKDVKASFDRYFELNPKDFSWRQGYAYDAYLCGQYSIFLEQMKLCTSTNHAWWGGEEKTRKMLAAASSALKD